MRTVEIVLTDSEIKAFSHSEDANNFAFEWWREELGRLEGGADSNDFYEKVNERVIKSRSDPWSDLLGIFSVEVEG